MVGAICQGPITDVRHALGVGLVCAVVAIFGCGGGLGKVRVALTDATACTEHCVDGFGAQLFDEANQAPLTPPREVDCGQTIVFVNLDAGRKVWVHAYATRAGQRRFEGESGPVEVLEDQVVTVPVVLKPVDEPTIAQLTPDPASPGETITIVGKGFGQDDGPHGVYLDSRPLDVISWADDRVEARLDPKDDGGFVTVASCGVSSPAKRIRVLIETPGVQVLSPLGCSGWTIEDATAVAGATDMVLALGCKDPGEGYLVRYDPLSCTPFGLPTALHGRPKALAPIWSGQELVVAVGKSLYRVSISLPPALLSPVASAPKEVEAVAATASRLFCLTAGQAKALYEIKNDGTLAQVLEDIEIVAIAAAPSRMVAVGKGAEPAIAVVQEDGPRIDVKLDAIPTAVALSSDGQRVVVACAGSRLLAVDLTSFTVSAQEVGFPTDTIKLALDLASDAAAIFDATTGTFGVVSFGPTSRVRTWALPPRASTRAFARHPGQDHFLLTGPEAGQMTVVAPYESLAPCKEVAP